jgi:hypothetical protein
MSDSAAVMMAVIVLGVLGVAAIGLALATRRQRVGTTIASAVPRELIREDQHHQVGR